MFLHEFHTRVSKIEVVVCDYTTRFSKTEEPCQICVVKEQEQRYDEQWDNDESGYCICAECGEKTDGGLPKRCNCIAFIDTDGEAKCQRCKELWTEPSLELGACGECGYDGD